MARQLTEEPIPTSEPLARLVGDGVEVPCVDGSRRRYVNLDSAASTSAFEAVARAVEEFLPLYSSVHRGAGYKSRRSTDAYESARAKALEYCRSRGPNSIAILCRNTTEAINHLAYRLRLEASDVVLTTVVEHHANLLPWARVARRRYVECTTEGTFAVDEVVAGLEADPRPRLLAVTGASNVTGFLPPLGGIIEAAHERGVPVVYVAFSGHKLYAPFGTGVLVGPRSTFEEGDPFLAGGGAVDLVDLDEVIWTEPREREEAGSPNVVGAVALDTALCELERIGWEQITAHEERLARRLRNGLASIPGVKLLGPPLDVGTLAIATFVVEGAHHALVAVRLSAEWGIGVRHGCFCAHPYLIRLLGLSEQEVKAYRERVMHGDQSQMPGAVRASCSISSPETDIDELLRAVTVVAKDASAPSRRHPQVPYVQDPRTADFWPVTDSKEFSAPQRNVWASCGRG
jgi:selenocysteine lyase/cysteine desulfurase